MPTPEKFDLGVSITSLTILEAPGVTPGGGTDSTNLDFSCFLSVPPCKYHLNLGPNHQLQHPYVFTDLIK